MFLWDHVMYRPPVRAVTDPWIALAAMAVATERIELGPMVTPLARRRPWIVARQAVALDRLSGGRLILGLGLGLDGGGERASGRDRRPPEGRHAGRGARPAGGLLSGEAFDHRGEHYQARDVRFLPGPARQGGLPIWLAGRWPTVA